MSIHACWVVRTSYLRLLETSAAIVYRKIPIYLTPEFLNHGYHDYAAAFFAHLSA
jgi:hypothetical protein